jgi:hypothetical protein
MGQIVAFGKMVLQHFLPYFKPNVPIYGNLWEYPPSIRSPLSRKHRVQAGEDHIQHQQEVLQLLKDNLYTVKRRMEHQDDQKHVESQIKGVGYF